MDRLSTRMHSHLSGNVIQALNKRQIFTVEDFITTETQQLALISRLVFKDILEIRKHLLKKFAPKPINAFENYTLLLKNSAILSTGVNDVDNLLEGGFFTSNIYEICGTPASGKSVFALLLAKNVAAKMRQKCYFLDTKLDFSGRKFKTMLENNFSPGEILNIMQRVLVKQISTKYELLNSLHQIKTELETGLQLRLVIIDSLSSVILDTADISENNLILSHIANIMNFIAINYHVAFVVTNLLTTWLDGDFRTQKSLTELVACGKYWQNVPYTRLKFMKLENNETQISIIKSYTLPVNKSITVNLFEEK